MRKEINNKTFALLILFAAILFLTGVLIAEINKTTRIHSSPALRTRYLLCYHYTPLLHDCPENMTCYNTSWYNNCLDECEAKP